MKLEKFRVPGYIVGKNIARLVSLIGWVSVVAGFVSVFFTAAISLGFVSGDAHPFFPEPALVTLLIGLGTVVGGLVIVVVGQAAVAIMNNANDTREMLDLLKENHDAANVSASQETGFGE